MDDSIQKLITDLNHPDAETRLESLRALMEKIHTGEIAAVKRGSDVNNHIHSTYSFSPYSPAKAVWMAYNAGLATAGLMDHDSISGAEEFIKAGETVGMATTVGVECRADFSGTPLKGRRINNPDQDSIAYIAIHGIPHTQFPRVRQFFAPYSEHRNMRNRLMADRLNDILKACKLRLDFDNDIVPRSMYKNGGSITERHILYALSLKLTEAAGKGRELLNLLKSGLGLNISPKLERQLGDAGNPYYDFDLLGLLKGELVASFYVEASAECPDAKDVTAFSDSIGAVSAYAYLGDVADSVTGDKRAQRFEDGYIGSLFPLLKELGFRAITYMPSRNSPEQLNKVRLLCEEYGFFQISGEDINSPRQPFVCQAMRDKAFRNLIDAAWALIGHELEATRDLSGSMFSPVACLKYPDLKERTDFYAQMARRAYGENPATN